MIFGGLFPKRRDSMKKTASLLICVLTLISAAFSASAADNGYTAYLNRFDTAVCPQNEITVFEGNALCKKGSELTAEFNVTESGFYNLSFEYCSETDADGNLQFGLMTDGEYPFDSAEEFTLPRYYRDSGKVRTDGVGNEFAPAQEEIKEKHSCRLTDTSGFSAEPCRFYFEKGGHSLKITPSALPFRLYAIKLCGVKKAESYKNVSAGYTFSEYKGETLLIEGEGANKKSSADLGAKSDSTTPNVYPANAYYQKINYIGGSNWSDVGDALYWEVDIPEDGLYAISIYYRQNYILNGNSYRSLTIDGETPFSEAAELAFPYNSGWKLKKIADENGEPYLFELKKGKHTLSLCVTLGPLSEFCESLENTVYDIGTLYRRLVMVTGETPDANRDYNLFGQIPDFEENLTDIKGRLEKLAKSYEELSGKRGGSTVSTINSMANTIASMLKYKYKAQQYKSVYYSNYSSLSAALYDMMSMPLDIDTFTFSSKNAEKVKGNRNIFEKAAYSAERFIASFVVDYNNISDVADNDKKLTLWVNWGRDQAQVLNFLIQSGFTEKTGIAVDVKITNASLVQGILSGNMPDCVLQHVRTEPINLAMRGALYDLSQFEDFEEITKRFSANALNPYKYKNRVYALPDTQSFMMMFIRTDIFEESGLSVPRTWDEFIGVNKILSGNNLETGIAGIYQSLLLQKGGNLYNAELNATDLLSPASVSAFEMYTDFFNKYDCPMTYNFYNRFRTGLMPLGIQDYIMYATLKATAPEINGKWQMFELPGTVREDGSIDNSSAGAGTACMILKDTGREKETWEFLKWWTSAETQVSYSRSLEGMLGIAGRVAVSNIEAAGELSWDGDNFTSLRNQWNSVGEFNEIPGSYYMTRVLEQAYWNVVVQNENPRDMLYKWGAVADNEIKRKIAQYEKN